MKKRSFLSLVAASLFAIGAAGGGPALAGTSSGNGAQKSGLAPAPDSTDASNKCRSNADTGKSAANGWAILNKTGQPVAGAVSTFQGEVHLIGGAPTSSYDIYVGQPGNDTCTVAGVLTTNGQGIGNGHIPSGAVTDFTSSDGTYFVVLTQSGSTTELFASSPVPEI